MHSPVTAMAFNTITLEISDSVAFIKLSRPDRLSSLEKQLKIERDKVRAWIFR